jgi:hypothetical protein
MGMRLQSRIGRDSGRLVCRLFIFSPAFPYIFLHLSAAGNPDPEKIGAFGVGE